ncbi:formate dehydrogenase 2 subunit beta (cytochrome c-553) [Desulfosarcina widdelii]|uniref:Formate dehydrogenase 2 subunit beta (Cytochrome c-553) n=1 Tax=Desulfosarcina widdelii TaxID=947919 RepID=A0A5K7Z4R4_9BACT|nr:4Fe-4S dicluster domain-containing protein [Desulfosarcina widdelii]BBO75690.1 formate dehydrogenase 2 subunit beta (cytochrome c-553) [Desulfosarcina widdelii]
MAKSFLIDTSRCTACRGCQIACKEWFELPANKTKQTGSHQNPPDLNPNNYKIVRFSEHLEGNTIRWYFFPDQCRHCIDPPCVAVGGDIVEGAIIHDKKTGAVVYTDKTRQLSEETFEEMRESCPYNIPRRDPTTGRISKCTMCNDRVVRGLLPVCVQVCPTGAMNFGEREEMLTLAQKRLARVKKEHPKAMLADPDDVNVIYLLVDDPTKYYEFSVAQFIPGLDRKAFLAKLGSPLRKGVRSLLRV